MTHAAFVKLTQRSLQTSPGVLWTPQESLDPLSVSPVTQVFGIDESAMATSPTEISTGRRMSKDGESGAARSHPFYNAPPQADGFFHCPFEGKDGCDHKPEALKCNYRWVELVSATVPANYSSKHIDSHLRPYRCKHPSCYEQQFSSTACLLRHEREAHGMHGHGKNPFDCPYPGCERSEPGKGFPRRWNLSDHMKRVHKHTGRNPANPASTSGSSCTGDRRPSVTKAKHTKVGHSPTGAKLRSKTLEFHQMDCLHHLDFPV